MCRVQISETWFFLCACVIIRPLIIFKLILMLLRTPLKKQPEKGWVAWPVPDQPLCWEHQPLCWEHN